MKFRYLFLTILLAVAVVVNGQNIVATTGPVHIEGQFMGLKNQPILLVNKNLGGVKSPVATAQTDENGKFEIDTVITVRDYYFLRLPSGDFINLVLQPKDDISVFADVSDLNGTINIKGSEHSILLNQFLIEMTTFKNVEDSLKKVLKADPQKQMEVNAYFSPYAQHFYTYRNNFINSNQSSPALIVALNSIDQQKEWALYKNVVNMLQYSFGDSPTIQELGAFLVKREGQIKQQEAATKAKNEMFKPGTLVKEIALPDTSGNVLKLSSLRGKIVLIDFWASWCGPCRKENPNVVKAYNKYNKDGFEVYSISLDKPGARARWVAAIQKDGLIWSSHVSDLQGWASTAAKDYAVRSIPFTVLIDREGKVIGTNLRGPRLEEELKRIFGH